MEKKRVKGNRRERESERIAEGKRGGEGIVDRERSTEGKEGREVLERERVRKEDGERP